MKNVGGIIRHRFYVNVDNWIRSKAWESMHDLVEGQVREELRNEILGTIVYTIESTRKALKDGALRR